MLLTRAVRFCSYILTFVLITACMMRTTQATLKQEKTDKPGVFLTDLSHPEDSYNDKILIILDIDDTIITPPKTTWLTSSMIFYDLKKKYEQKHPSDAAFSGDRLDPLLTITCDFIMPILTDKTLPKVIKRYQEDPNVTLLMMTSRGFGLIDVTLKQLEHVGINLEKPEEEITYYQTKKNKDKRHFAKKSNLVMASHGNTKGDVLSALIAEKKIPEKFAHVIMVDDKNNHLESVGNIAAQIATQYTAVLCTYPDEKNKTYNSEKAMEQLKRFIIQYRATKVVKSLLDSDQFTKEFVEEHNIKFE